MLELLIERQRSERQTQIGKFFFQTHHRLHELTDQNHSIQILWLADVQRLTCPLWVVSGHLLGVRFSLNKVRFTLKSVRLCQKSKSFDEHCLHPVREPLARGVKD